MVVFADEFLAFLWMLTLFLICLVKAPCTWNDRSLEVQDEFLPMKLLPFRSSVSPSPDMKFLPGADVVTI